MIVSCTMEVIPYLSRQRWYVAQPGRTDTTNKEIRTRRGTFMKKYYLKPRAGFRNEDPGVGADPDWLASLSPLPPEGGSAAKSKIIELIP